MTHMTESSFKIEDYLKRVGYEGNPALLTPTLSVLTEIMRHQLYAIPFENADIWYHKKIPSLNLAEIVDKIIYAPRGGYCYELNGLFCLFMESVGFKYKMVAARPRFNYTARRPKTHMVMLVTIDEKEYLCDLSFGGYGIREPIDLSELDREIVQRGDRFKLLKTENEYLLRVFIEGKWADLYSFDTYECEWIDYVLPNYFNATSTDTIFTKKRLAIIQKADYRCFLVDNELKVVTHEGSKVIDIVYDEYDIVLRNEFGIVLDLKQM